MKSIGPHLPAAGPEMRIMSASAKAMFSGSHHLTDAQDFPAFGGSLSSVRCRQSHTRRFPILGDNEIGLVS